MVDSWTLDTSREVNESLVKAKAHTRRQVVNMQSMGAARANNTNSARRRRRAIESQGGQQALAPSCHL